MKLLKLEVQNVRGVKQVQLDPVGANLVIFGPNGAGKSGIVDALDFLLTGRISRLTGKGTKGISLERHGPHIDCKVGQAEVRAVVELPGRQDPVVLRRALEHPEILEVPVDAEEAIAPALALASRGHHVLCRRDLLRYVTAEAGTRAQEVQALLNLSPVEAIRKSLRQTITKAKSVQSTARSSARSAKELVASTLGLTAEFDDAQALAKTNGLRAPLGGAALVDLKPETLKAGLSPPGARSSPTNADSVRQAVQSIKQAVERASGTLPQIDESLRKLLHGLRGDEIALRDAETLRFLEIGGGLIADDGSCPLCGTGFAVGLLKERVALRISAARQASEKLERIGALSEQIATQALTLRKLVADLRGASSALLTEADGALYGKWLADLDALGKSLADRLHSDAVDATRIAVLMTPTGAMEALDRLAGEAAKLPASTEAQQAWDTLTRLEDRWGRYTQDRAKASQAEAVVATTETLERLFEEARDSVLNGLYQDVQKRFATLYKLVHGDDEPAFESELRPEGAGLNFQVDFYGRGKHPPQALHSEGHQDSMGLCLYLALVEKLTKDVFGLTMLDDVVMSVDSEHRRSIARLLATEFPGRQFLITTHDRVWARELEVEGAVSRPNVIEFIRWTVDTGPFVSSSGSVWAKIEEEIAANDIPSAAARLRRWLEQYFELVCDSLRAKVRYRSDGRWELGDFIQAAVATYKDCIKKAKAAANSWNDKDSVQRLSDRETAFTSAHQQAQVEQVAVNVNVHFNKWATHSATDFRPVVKAMREFCDAFACPYCHQAVRVVVEGSTPTSLSCSCGKSSATFTTKAQTATAS